jgi:hypothetical protein
MTAEEEQARRKVKNMVKPQGISNGCHATQGILDQYTDKPYQEPSADIHCAGFNEEYLRDEPLN